MSDRKAMLITPENYDRILETRLIPPVILDAIYSEIIPADIEMWFVYGGREAMEFLTRAEFKSKYRWTALQDNYNGVEKV